MEAEEYAVYSEPPFREEEPPCPPDPKVAIAQTAVWKALEVEGVSEISPEIVEGIDPGNGMLSSGGRFGRRRRKRRRKRFGGRKKKLEEEAGDLAGEGSSRKDDSEKDSGLGSIEEGIPAWKKVHVLDAHGNTDRSYSVERFGQILQLSQWSLRHRIEVCQVLQNSSNRWIMSPLSRHAYAKQSLALINRELKDIGDESSVPGSLEDSWKESDREVLMEVEKLVYQDQWTLLTGCLEEELLRLREEDKTKTWYTTMFKSEGSFQPEDIYLAVETGQVCHDDNMMLIVEHWALIRPQEYQGATPMHWLALHLNNFPNYMSFFLCNDTKSIFERMRTLGAESFILGEESFTLEAPDDHKLKVYVKENVGVCDNFGFKILHMAIFASSWIPYFHPEQKHDRNETAISNCLQVIKSLTRADMETMMDDDDDYYNDDDQGTRNDDEEKAGANQEGTYTWPASDFFIFKRSNYRSSLCYGKDEYDDMLLIPFLSTMFDEKPYSYGIKNHLITSIHFLHLAIGISHPHVISMLITNLLIVNDSLWISLKGNDVFDVRTSCGDSILHLAAWGMDPNFKYDYEARQRVMVTLLQNLHYYPTLLNSSNEVGQRPLHIAAFQGSRECVEAFLRCLYIMRDVQNNNGLTPLDMAKKLDDWNVNKQRKQMKILGKKCVIDEEFGFSTTKYNDVITDKSYKEVADLIQGLNPNFCQWKLLQSSQWSLRHRILALQMISENPSTFENVRGPYVQQCLNIIDSFEMLWKTRPSLDMSLEGIIRNLRLKLMDKFSRGEFFNPTFQFNVLRDSKRESIKFRLQYLESKFSYPYVDVSKQITENGFWLEIFQAIEEDDVLEFKHLMMKIKRHAWSDTKLWSEGPLKEYNGATPLHWAALYGRRDMVSFMKNRMQDFDKGKQETWLQKNDNIIRDKFGFTPLHLAAFSGLRSGCTDENENKMGRDANETEELIDKLYEMGVPDTASSTSKSEFWVWNVRPDGIYLDDHLTTSTLHPMFLGVHFSHPHIVRKLLERTAHQNFAKNIMSAGDSILHCARAWEGLIKHCSEDEWRKIETVLLLHLENIPKAVNSRNFNRETPLHIAVCTKSLKWMEVLLQTEHVKFTLRDRDILTPGDRATKMLEDPMDDAKDDIQNIVDLIDSFDPESVPRKEKEQKQKAREEKKEREKKLEEERKKEMEQKQKEREEMKEREKKLEEERKKEVEQKQKEREEKKDKEKKLEEERKKEVEQKQKEREEREEREKKEVEQKQKEREDRERREKELEATRKRDRDERVKKEKEEEDNRKKIEGLQRDRQVYVDAANAILVGGALVASASFGAWLQPPLGFHPYYSPEFLDTAAPPPVGPVYESFVAIQQYRIIHAFWVFNSLSFFFSLATVIAGADAALPQPGYGSGTEQDVENALNSVKKAVKRAAWLLILAIIFVICTFATLGFTVLPPITKYRINLIVTVVVGGGVCIRFLIVLGRKLVS